MVVDSSVLIGILQGEPEEHLFYAAFERSPVVLLGTATLFETSMILLSRRGDRGLEDLTKMLDVINAEVVALTAAHANLALDAFRRYGKGRHRAGLNMGDCFSYALAKATGLPLLFKGDDFVHTDVKPAV